MYIFYDQRYVGSEYSFDTTKKAAQVAQVAEKMPGVVLTSPRAATQRELALVHDPRYVREVLTGEGDLATSAGFSWDEGYARAVSTSTGGVVDAAFAALRDGVAGSLSSGLHHANKGRGSGFCTFNGLALAAKIALGDRPRGEWPRKLVAPRCRRVLILDLDAHCGGGTYDIIKDDTRIWQTDVSVCYFDSYTSKSPRHDLRVVTKASEYLIEIERALEAAKEKSGGFDLVLYNSGMDPHEDCAIGGLTGITSEVIRLRERMVFNWARANGYPVAFVLAGGYTGPDLSEERLTMLHQMTIAAATQGKMPDMTQADKEAKQARRARKSKTVVVEVVPSESLVSWEEIYGDTERYDTVEESDFENEPGVRIRSIHELRQDFFDIDAEDLRAQFPEFFE